MSPLVRISCPTCRREEDVEDGFRWRPFCSRRCKIIDLGNWLDEVYRISVPVEDEELIELPESAAN
jgi:endogenous inhibitor of DNA gyrase (YacG/DUF329 family)